MENLTLEQAFNNLDIAVKKYVGNEFEIITLRQSLNLLQKTIKAQEALLKDKENNDTPA